MIRSLARHKTQKIGAFLLALSQVFFVVGCRQATGGGSKASALSASTAAGSTAGVNVGLIAYDTLHHSYETNSKTAQADALEIRRDDFIDAINRILPSDVSGNLFPTLLKLLPLVDDGTVEGAINDVDNTILRLLQDPTALEGIVKLMNAAPTGASASRDARATNLLISRVLSYPEMDKLAQAFLELLEANDGVDANGLPNGERDLLRQIQGVLSRTLQGHQPPASGTSTASQTLEKLAKALLDDRPLQAFPNLGAPAYAVRIDVNGNPKVLADPATGLLPVPFIDSDSDGVADVDAAGEPIDAAGTPIAISAFGNDGNRDLYGRAKAPGGAFYYDYFDSKRTMLSEVMLLSGELLKRDVAGKAVIVIDGVTQRVAHDNGTIDPSDDYFTLSPNSPLLDLTYANFEITKRTALPELLSGLAEVVKNDPQKFARMVDTLLVAIKQASSAANTVPPAPGGGTALANDLLPLLEDVLAPRGRNTSAMRALLQAFNSQQRVLQTLPPSFANMMKFHDFRTRTPADATHKSIMHRVLDMMVAANQCNAPLLGNTAELYLKAMAGTQRILGINISTNTIHRLMSVPFLRRLMCAGIKESDVLALQDFDRTGALAAMKPIARVFADRGEITLLKDIMLGLQKHYEGVMRPTEPTAVAILESGGVEKLFEVLDEMTQVRVPGSNLVVADALADTLQGLMDSSTPVYDRSGVAHKNLAELMSAPMDQLSNRAQQSGVTPEFDSLMSDLGDVLLATYVDDMGTPDPADDVERWKWQGMSASMGDLLSFAADAIPANPADRAQWAADSQRDMTDLLTGRDIVFVIDVLKTIATSPQKDVISRALTALLTPQQAAQSDVFGALLVLIADGLAHKPQSASTLDAQALADVLHFLGRELDPNLSRLDSVFDLVFGIIAADDGLLLLRLARNAFDKGANGVNPSPVEVITEVFDDISAASASSGSTTVADLQDSLNSAHDFINDPVDGLPPIIARIKGRRR